MLRDFDILDNINVGKIGFIKPVPIDGSGSEPPDHSEIRKIAEDVLGAVKYSFAAVAANPGVKVRADSLEADFKEAIQALPSNKKTAYKKVAADLIKAPVNIRTAMFGRAGQRNADEHIGSVGGFARFDEGLPPLQIDKKLLGIKQSGFSINPDMINRTPDGILLPSSVLPDNFEKFESDFEENAKETEQSNVFDSERLAEIWGATYASDPFQNTAAEDEFEEFAVTDKMGFWITKVKCVDETNPEFWGHDEIALAGVSVDETGDTKKINETFIGGGFDDGDSKSYPNWKYTWFNMNEGNFYPKTYSVTMLLAEKDNGGLSDALNGIWVKIRDKVKAAIAKAVSEALSGYLGPAIAAAIGKAVAWVVDVFVGWIIRLFKDDIFPAFTARVTTPSMSARWYYPNGTWGNPSSGIRTAHFYGHGGHYYVQYYWKFHS